MRLLKINTFFEFNLQRAIDKDVRLQTAPGFRAARALPNLLLDAALDPLRFADEGYCRRLVGDAWECLCSSRLYGQEVGDAFRQAARVNVTFKLLRETEQVAVHLRFLGGYAHEENQLPFFEMSVAFQAYPRLRAILVSAEQ